MSRLPCNRRRLYPNLGRTRLRVLFMIRKAAALTLLLILFAALPAVSWTVSDCVEVDYDHPDCDQYPSTTIPRCEYNPNHPFCQTTTTTTEVEQTTTTVEVTTTVQQQNTTTTTAAPCAPGLIHQPPLCVNPSTTVPVQVSSTVVTAAALEQLPFTGAPSSMLAVASSLFLLAGLAVLGLRRRAV